MLAGFRVVLVSAIGLVAAMALGGLALAQEPTHTDHALAPPTAAEIAACPAGHTLTVSPPSASAPNTVGVTVSPQPPNTPPVSFMGDSWGHFVYFVDTDPTPAGQYIPDTTKIIHGVDQYFGIPNVTRDLTKPYLVGYTGGALSAGQHTVWVALGWYTPNEQTRSMISSGHGANVACDLRGSVTFTVAAALPGTGSGGYLDQNSSRLPMLTWLALAGVSLVALCLGAVLRRRV